MNREGFNFELAMVKACSRPLLNKYALQKKKKKKKKEKLKWVSGPHRLRWWWSLKTHLSVLKGKIKCVQKGSSGTYFDHGQFEIKTFPIYGLP